MCRLLYCKKLARFRLARGNARLANNKHLQDGERSQYDDDQDRWARTPSCGWVKGQNLPLRQSETDFFWLNWKSESGVAGLARKKERGGRHRGHPVLNARFEATPFAPHAGETMVYGD